MKKPSIKTLEKKLWELTREYVFKRDNYTCQKCGKKLEGQNCHPSHIIPKSRSKYLKYDPLNILTMDFYHHIHWWHANPVEAGEWFISKFPRRWLYLKKHKHKTAKFKRDDYERMIDEIKRIQTKKQMEDM